MKKFFAMLLALVMALSLVACGEQGGQQGGDDSDQPAGNDAPVAYVLAEKGDTYSLGLASNFQTAFEKLGGTVVMETFPTNTTNFSDYLQKAIDKGADVIFAPNSITVASSLLPQANDLGVECPIMAGDTWESSVILDGMANTGLDVYCSTFFDESDSSSTAAADFVNGFKAWLNANPDALNDNGGNDIVAAVSALGYDAYNVAVAAIRAAAEAKGADMTSVDVAAALWTLTYENAVTGQIQFNATGDAIKNCAYIKKAAADGSKFEFVKTQEVENSDVQATGFDYGDAAGVKLDTANHKIVIGVYEPLTGNNGGGGKQEVLGMKYANSLDNKIEIAGEEYTVELYVSDNGSLEENAVSAASAIVSSGALISLGSYGSGVSIAAADTFAEAQIPAIGVSCTNASVTDGHDWYFRICFLDPFQGTVLANYASSELKATKAYCLGENGNEYDQGLVTFFKQAFEKAGGTVVTDSFPKDNSDFSSYLNKAKDQGCDVIFAPVSIAYSTQLVSQAASLNIGIPFLGSDTWDDNMVLQAAKGTSVQAFVSTFYAEGGNKTFDDGIKAYINGNADAKTTNGGDDTISAVTAMGYDVYYVALEALKAAGSTDPAKVMEALPGVIYDGVSGHIAFDETGDAIRDTAYIKTIDSATNAWKFVTQQKAS